MSRADPALPALPPTAQTILLYGSDLCEMTPAVRNLFERASVAYDYVSISRNRGARQQVMGLNDGQASVPTVVFADGSTLTQPKLDVLSAKLQAMGYTVAPETFGQGVLLTLQSPRLLYFGGIFLAIGVSFGAPALTFAGAVLLPLGLLGRLAATALRRRQPRGGAAQ